MGFEHRYPIYVPSKGRAEYQYTIPLLIEMRAAFFVIVEEQEYAAYARRVPKDRLLVLPQRMKDEYELCASPADPVTSTGSGPARNYAAEHAATLGAKRHWVIDDNIKRFSRRHRGKRLPVRDSVFFRVMEDWCDQYTNVAMAGPQYRGFVPDNQRWPPMTFNHRIYSCNLILGSAPFRWRGRYNEDTILSLDMLKAGWVTAMFNYWLAAKMPTQKVPGGNTTELYEAGTFWKSSMLVRVHPDVASHRNWKGRHHHWVDYRPFAGNRLIRDPDAEPIPDYGFRLANRGVRDARIDELFADEILTSRNSP